MLYGEKLYRLRVRLVLAIERCDLDLAADIKRRIAAVERAAWL